MHILKKETQEILLEPLDNLRLLSLCGPLDNNLKNLEKQMNIDIHHRNHKFTLIGKKADINVAKKVLQELYANTSPINGTVQNITLEQIYLAIKTQGNDSVKTSTQALELLNIKTRKGVIKPRTANQADYLENISRQDITFGIGPAGTGKTWLAVAAAVDAFERQQVRRILLTRPAVEAGEKLGFLPGDLSQKVDPYLRPLYDALFDMLGEERVEKLIERNFIEIAPLAYMRGRTLSDAFVILDESQNTTLAQMKMFLTRIGFHTKMVITGDITQIDLPVHTKSGLRHAMEVLTKVQGIGFTFFGDEDVVRHPVVARIVKAYEKWEKDHKSE